MWMKVKQRSISHCVVGSGPAGICLVSRLLDIDPTAKISWVDPSFAGGRLQKYKNVPSNTRVSLFLEFARVSPSLSALMKDDATSISALLSMNQDKGCSLSYALDFCTHLLTRMREVYGDRITFNEGWVSDVEYSTQSKKYKVKFHADTRDDFDSTPSITGAGSSLGQMDNLYLCTGAVPVPSLRSNPHRRVGKPHPKLLDLDVCLNPVSLGSVLSSKDHVVVVGSSHSAILIMKNLSELASRPKITNFYLSPLKYAVHMPEGWILYDNTGLKQMAATWAKTHLESNNESVKIGIERVCVDSSDSGNAYEKTMPNTSHIVYAIGFSQRSLPTITIDDVAVKNVGFDKKTGHLHFDGEAFESARGFGIGFPQETVDPAGNVESSVGIWKFRNYITKVIQ